MRVISGSSKGRRLLTRPGRQTRPTADRVKEALFDVLGNVTGLRVLDIFAGSGALGIEALSRGALECVFIERNHQAVKLLRENLLLTELEPAGKVLQGDVLKVIPKLEGQFDLILLDPPYFSVFIDKLMGQLTRLQSEGGCTVWEHHKDENSSAFAPFKEKQYGITALSFFDLEHD